VAADQRSHAAPAAEVVAELSRRFGQPLARSVALPANSYLSQPGTHPREAEVCMVIRRPGGRVLTFRKDFYPPGIYRLPTGGVERGEPILAALGREAREEIGFDLRVTRFLAVVTHHLPPGGAIPRFVSYAFLLDGLAGPPVCADPAERVVGYRDVEPSTLSAIAAQLDALEDAVSDELRASWRDWGRFRAVIHRAVWEALAAGER
jgi:8-oxo-dGTP pyrophosphatase MutT (NUDIX family)